MYCKAPFSTKIHCKNNIVYDNIPDNALLLTQNAGNTLSGSVFQKSE